MERGIQPKIGLVLTHIDEVQEDREEYIKSYIKGIHLLFDGKPYAGYISENNIFVTEKKPPIRSMNNLKDQVFQLIVIYSI